MNKIVNLLQNYLFITFLILTGTVSTVTAVDPWNKHTLRKLAHQSKYGMLFESLYHYRDVEKQSEPISLAHELAEEGHAPCMYFLVRDWAQSNFSNFNTQTLEEALMWAIISLASIKGDSECCNIHTDIEKTYIIFCQKFYQKFMNADDRITEQMVNNSIDNAEEWCNTHYAIPVIFEGPMENWYQITTCPCWVASVSLTGYSTLTFNDKLINTAQQYFTQELEKIAQKRLSAQKRFFIKLRNCLEFYKANGQTKNYALMLFPYQLPQDYGIAGYSSSITSSISSLTNLLGFGSGSRS